MQGCMKSRNHTRKAIHAAVRSLDRLIIRVLPAEHLQQMLKPAVESRDAVS